MFRDEGETFFDNSHTPDIRVSLMHFSTPQNLFTPIHINLFLPNSSLISVPPSTPTIDEFAPGGHAILFLSLPVSGPGRLNDFFESCRDLIEIGFFVMGLRFFSAPDRSSFS